MSERYVCECCGGTFDKGRSDDEASAEFAENFPGQAPSAAATALVCDDCYPVLMAFRADEPIRRAAEVFAKLLLADLAAGLIPQIESENLEDLLWARLNRPISAADFDALLWETRAQIVVQAVRLNERKRVAS
jgi:hypothetical protein